MKGYTGWEIPKARRTQLLRTFPPRYQNVIAHHVTMAFGVDDDYPLPTAVDGWIVGMADDGLGVQAMVVEIGGTTKRPDGSTYHSTWSLGPERKAKESNDVIKLYGFKPVRRTPLSLTPMFFPMGK
jgi:hypothetical protein